MASFAAYDNRESSPIATAPTPRTKTSRQNASDSSYPLGALHEMHPKLKEWYNTHARRQAYSDKEDKGEQAQEDEEEAKGEEEKDIDTEDDRMPNLMCNPAQRSSSRSTGIPAYTESKSYLNVKDFFRLAQEVHGREREREQAPTMPNPNPNPNLSSAHIPRRCTIKLCPCNQGWFCADPYIGYACLVVDHRLGETVGSCELDYEDIR